MIGRQITRVLVAATALALLPLLPGCPERTEASVEVQETKTFVRTAHPERKDLVQTLELTGTVGAARQADLVASIPGKIEKIPVKVGDKVKKGQLLVQLETDIAALQADQAAAALALAELSVASSQRELDRAIGLHAEGGLSDQMLEQAQTGAQMATQQLVQARAAKGLAAEQVDGGGCWPRSAASSPTSPTRRASTSTR